MIIIVISLTYGDFSWLSNFALFVTCALEAARNTLIQRGDPSTGWSMGWKVCFWARCLDGNHAFKLITNQLNLVSPEVQKGQGGGTYPICLMLIRLSRLMETLGCTAGITKC